MRKRSWVFRHKVSNYEHRTVLMAYWEADHDPISDDYTTDEVTAVELFEKWRRKVAERHPDGLVPIHWFAEGDGILEFMPFQHVHVRGYEIPGFLDEFTWPTEAETGQRLRWAELPVIDKRWRRGDAAKGGFIQEATGWKPSILQPYLYMPALTERDWSPPKARPDHRRRAGRAG
jgi:hypothetical protein